MKTKIIFRMLALLFCCSLLFQASGQSKKTSDKLETLEVWLPFHDEKTRVTVEVLDGLAILQGDIVLGRIEDLRTQNSSTSSRGMLCSTCNLWPNSTIPYTISSQFSDEYIELILEAINYLTIHTNICMVERTDETDYVNIIANQTRDCDSFVGKIGGAQSLWLNDNTDGAGCSRADIVHELLHTVGLWHEQSRPDRDEYVNVHWENIKTNDFHFFYQYVGQIHGPYDYYSIMHNGPFDYSHNGQPTLTRKNGTTDLGGGSIMTQQDIESVNLLYPESCPSGCNGCAIMGDESPSEKLAVDNLARFVSEEMHGNYKMAEQVYIRHKKQIDNILNTIDPRYRSVQTAWAAVKMNGTKAFLRAFLYYKNNEVTDEGLAGFRHFLSELAKAIDSPRFDEDVAKISRLLGVTRSLDLKSALIAFDEASLEELPAQQSAAGERSTAGQFGVQLTGNLGLASVLHYSLPAAGQVEVRLFEVSGKAATVLLSSDVAAGQYHLPIKTSHLVPGIYLVQLQYSGRAGDFTETEKMVVSR